MGRSQVSFNKRENEKKKAKKKQDKLQKREERKASAEKGKSLDDMIAYVDEFGNITDTPPDPNQKEDINVEDIEVAVAKQEPIDPADLIRKGVVSHFNHSKGYGFIKDIKTQETFFVHVNSLEEEIQERDKVTFETEMGMKGMQAVNVKIVNDVKSETQE
ncbi:MAG TPA: cold shock domain-containing protein [Tenuifilaceae bacterium]|nr:cold shock domain-containing protein [Tenuifilaceae bacterium]HPE18366.1 cold shock domain-containing protein [Tenuifilaceae bacterium]HPJ45093.1 cold shock domain-containing protein [Tenuifilaceae bacterium]HPQ34482.1 cold shock domain-containing protein [Tenuifilaceae bacterium]HRX67490.1 cold shock domain-containing protein [Tenuifilaceae bacterium]